jgi:hypothetical protein
VDRSELRLSIFLLEMKRDSTDSVCVQLQSVVDTGYFLGHEPDPLIWNRVV